jgi:quercetin dioxygenase-like cupin family protein
MIIRHLAEIDAESIELSGMLGVASQGILLEHPQLKGFLVRMFTLEPNGHTGLHHHPQQHLHYFLRGRGQFVGDGGREQPVEAGDTLLTEPDEWHQVKNASPDESLQFLDVVGPFAKAD